MRGVCTLFVAVVLLTGCVAAGPGPGSGPLTLTSTTSRIYEQVYKALDDPGYFIVSGDGVYSDVTYCDLGPGQCEVDLIVERAVNLCNERSETKCYLLARGEEQIWDGPVTVRVPKYVPPLPLPEPAHVETLFGEPVPESDKSKVARIARKDHPLSGLSELAVCLVVASADGVWPEGPRFTDLTEEAKKRDLTPDGCHSWLTDVADTAEMTIPPTWDQMIFFYCSIGLDESNRGPLGLIPVPPHSPYLSALETVGDIRCRDVLDRANRLYADGQNMFKALPNEAICRAASADKEWRYDLDLRHYVFRHYRTTAEARSLTPERCNEIMSDAVQTSRSVLMNLYGLDFGVLHDGSPRKGVRMNDPAFCRFMLNDDRSDWKTGEDLSRYLNEVSYRALTPQECAEIIVSSAAIQKASEASAARPVASAAPSPSPNVPVTTDAPETGEAGVSASVNEERDALKVERGKAEVPQVASKPQPVAELTPEPVAAPAADPDGPFAGLSNFALCMVIASDDDLWPTDPRFEKLVTEAKARELEAIDCAEVLRADAGVRLTAIPPPIEHLEFFFCTIAEDERRLNVVDQGAGSFDKPYTNASAALGFEDCAPYLERINVGYTRNRQLFEKLPDEGLCRAASAVDEWSDLDSKQNYVSTAIGRGLSPTDCDTLLWSIADSSINASFRLGYHLTTGVGPDDIGRSGVRYNDAALCKLVLNDTQSGWSTDEKLEFHVNEVNVRNLTVGLCLALAS